MILTSCVMITVFERRYPHPALSRAWENVSLTSTPSLGHKDTANLEYVKTVLVQLDSFLEY